MLIFIKNLFTKDFWTKSFPATFPEECFNCNKGSCKKCSTRLSEYK